MKKLVVFLMAALMASGAMAQVPDPGPDSFGLYFDTDGNGDPNFDMNVLDGVAPGAYQAYMAVANPSGGDVGGIEIIFSIVDPSSGFIQGVTFFTNAIDIDNRPEAIYAGFGTAIPPENGFSVLGTLNLFAIGQMQLLAGPYDISPTIPGFPVYVASDGTEIPLVFATDMNGNGTNEDGWLTPEYALGAVNAVAGVAVEDRTWSDVKGLFR